MSSNNQTKKVEYDFVPTVALSVIVVVIITIVIVAVVFVWNLLSKTGSDAILASQGQIQATLINDQGQVIDVLAYRKADQQLLEQGGVDVVTKTKVQPIAQAMQQLLAHPNYLQALPEPAPVVVPQPKTPEQPVVPAPVRPASAPTQPPTPAVIPTTHPAAVPAR